MPQLPTSQPSERRPSHRWIWLSLLGLILLCGATLHRRQMPFQKSKDLSGYNYIYLSPADEGLEQLRDIRVDEGDEEDEESIVDNNGPIEGDLPRPERRRAVSRIYATFNKRAQFQEWEH